MAGDLLQGHWLISRNTPLDDVALFFVQPTDNFGNLLLQVLIFLEICEEFFLVEPVVS